MLETDDINQILATLNVVGVIMMPIQFVIALYNDPGCTMHNTFRIL